MKFISPLHVFLPRKTKADKKIILNLNVYRNTHYIVLNQAKKIYNQVMYASLIDSAMETIFTTIELEFTLFKGSKRKCDRANVYSIQEKFFCDFLVDAGFIEDDNDDYIIKSVYNQTQYDKDYPRCEIIVKEV